MANILVADDEAAVREFVSRALDHAGHKVTVAQDGQKALELLASGQFDLLITDIVMPRMDGISLALKMAKDRPDMPILLMTGYSAERQRAHNLDALTSAVIGKPFSLAEFLSAVETALGGGRPKTQ